MRKNDTKSYPPVSEMNKNQRIEIVKDIFSSITNKYDFSEQIFILTARHSLAKKNCLANEVFQIL